MICPNCGGEWDLCDDERGLGMWVCQYCKSEGDLNMESVIKKGFLQPEELIDVNDNNGKRVYNIVDIGKVESVTHILDKGFPKAYSLIAWFINNTKKDIDTKRAVSTKKGTACHEAFERLAKLHFNFNLLSLEDKEMLKLLIPWVETSRPLYVLSEAPICYISNTVKTAGRIDLLCEIHGERWLIDFKTGKGFYPSYGAQVGLYATAIGVKKAGILLLTEQGHQFKEINIEKGFKCFQAAYLLANYKGD